MSDTNNGSATDSGKKTGLIMASIVVLVGILAVAGYFIYQEYQDSQDLEAKTEKIEKELENLENEIAEEIEKNADEIAQKAKEDAISMKLQDELDATLAIIRVVKVNLSGDLLDDLELIREYIIENPSVLEDENAVIPADVQDAVDNVKAAYDGSYGTSESPATDEEQVKAGNKYVIEGVIEVSDYSDSILGTLYEVTDEELDVTLYFQFSEEVSEDVNENMLGEVVQLEVEITEVLSDGSVTYVVVSGPVLAE